jgi:hypothetical protein
MSVARIVTVTAPAPPPAGGQQYDLVSLDLVKQELSIGADNVNDDAWLARAISQTSRAISQYCNRVFQIEGISEIDYIEQDPYPYQTPGTLRTLILARWPLTGLFALPVAAAVASGNVLPFASTAGVAIGMSVAGLGLAMNTNVASFVANSSVTLSQPITAPILAGATMLFSFTLTQAIDGFTAQPLVYGRDYTIDPAHAFLYRLNPFTGLQMTWEALPITTTYQAGYAQVPSPVEEACLLLLTSRYRSRGRDPYLKAIEQPGLGIMTYWVGGPPKSGAMPEEIGGLLDNYRVPVVLA